MIGPLMRLLNKSGKLIVTHSCGGESVQKILKLAFKDKEAFPNTAKDIIDYLKKCVSVCGIPLSFIYDVIRNSIVLEFRRDIWKIERRNGGKVNFRATSCKLKNDYP